MPAAVSGKIDGGRCFVMKKTLLIFLSLLIMSTLLVSCLGDKNPDSSVDESTSQGDISENSDVSEISEEESDPEVIAKIGKINAALKYNLPDSYGYSNIIAGQKYTINLDSYSQLPDDGKKLTDNDDAALGDNEKWVGFLGRKDIEITVDLENLETNLGGFSVNCRYNTNAGENIPKICEFWISADGEEYVKIATSERYPSVYSSSLVYTHSAFTQKGFEARYIKIVLTGFVSQWTAVDAIKLYKIAEVNDTGEYYENDPLPEDVKPTFWNESEADYATYRNLIKGLPQRVYAGFNLEPTLRTEYYNTPANSTVLTDGKRGSSNYAESAYFHATKGLLRSFVYDLTHLSEVSKGVVGVYVKTDYAINYPDFISIELSEDGENWQTVSAESAEEFPNAVNSRIDLSFDFDGSYKARFVKFVLTVSAHCWIDEFEVWGTKKVGSSAKTIVPEDINVFDKGYPSPDVLGGSENILLAYNYKTESPAVGRTTKAGYLPYVGYYNTEGELVDFFFDSYLYLPCSTVCPSGGVLFSSGEKPSIKSDWLDYENDLFMADKNLSALEQVVEEVKTALGEENYKVNVFLSIFNPNVRCRSFGDVDNDSISEDLAKSEDRKKVVKWWIDRQIEKYNAENFGNQRLVGFYWYDEDLDLSNSLNKETLLYAIDYVHQLGYYIIWIPYYQAAGYTQWEKVGFDVANMQPNYMFREAFTEQILYDNAALTRMYGMGVEIEIQGKALTDPEYYDRYLTYLRVGVECGYMNSIKMYYQDAGPGVFYNAYKSNDPHVRAVYDITYQYAKRLLKANENTATDAIIETQKNTKYNGEVELKNGICLSASVEKASKYGSVTVSDEGKIIYTPMENFTGTDSFVLKVFDGVSLVRITYTVNVHK